MVYNDVIQEQEKTKYKRPEFRVWVCSGKEDDYFNCYASLHGAVIDAVMTNDVQDITVAFDGKEYSIGEWVDLKEKRLIK